MQYFKDNLGLSINFTRQWDCLQLKTEAMNELRNTSDRTYLILVIWDRYLKNKNKLHATFSCHQQRKFTEIQIRSNDKKILFYFEEPSNQA